MASTLAGLSLPVDAKPIAAQLIVNFNRQYTPAERESIVETWHIPGVAIQWRRAMSGNNAVIAITAHIANRHNLPDGPPFILANVGPETSLTDVIQYMTHISEINSITVDSAVAVTAVPNDPRFREQWQLGQAKPDNAALDVVRAWDITHGSADTIVAVIDTGVRFDHPDLAGRLLPGHDFVSGIGDLVQTQQTLTSDWDFLRSHDGDGRDTDPSDPGDSISMVEKSQFSSIGIECATANSSWHGTAVASIIAANANDNTGIAGIDWHARILPVRAIGKCGGRRSDLLDAIRWAAGVKDDALPVNPTPARIINLSLGIEDFCSQADQAAIDDAIAAGSIVISAVGNAGRNTDLNPTSPAHCQSVLGVMAVDHNALRANYSNFGRDADIAAPGGTIAPSIESILVASNPGLDNPQPISSYRQASGTSIAAPHVSAVLALMLAVNNRMSNRELEALLLGSARAFPHPAAKNACRPDQCGAGVLDAYAAVHAAEVHIAGDTLNIPALAAAQSVPVSVGSGCTIVSLRTKDPFLPSLCVLAGLVLYRRQLTNPLPL